MRFLSICSGIEAASAAWSPLGWKAVAFSEIEPFPCAVLAHHYPDVPNWGDMTKFQEWPNVPIDLLCGGTPCQSFSVAGLRKGLDDPRGNLMLTFGAIAAKYRPKWLVWENVPGVLSSNGGRDFGSFLGLLGVLGYGFAYRVLDAQYFGVAQRRRRVFVVGCLGDWHSAAAVLFERHSLSGHPAPRRQAGKVAPTIPSRSTAGGGLGTDFDCDGGLIQAFGGNNQSGPIDVATARNACASASGRMDFESETFLVSHSLRGEGFDASEDGTGRGAPLVPVVSPTLDQRAGRSGANSFATSGGLVPVLAFDTTQVTSAANRSNPKPGDPCHPLAAGAHSPAIAIQGTLLNRSDTAGPAGPAGSGISEDEISFTQTKTDVHAVAYGMQVRRLTPRECERLQGFQDDYTLVPHRGKPAADGPRYKALGNSWAVPCAAWIGRRIQMVEALL